MNKDYHITLDHDAELDPVTPLETWGVYPDDKESTLAAPPEKLGVDSEGNPVYKITLDQSVDTPRHYSKVNTTCSDPLDIPPRENMVMFTMTSVKNGTINATMEPLDDAVWRVEGVNDTEDGTLSVVNDGSPLLIRGFVDADSMRILRCISSELTELKILNLEQLTHIYCHDNKITHLSISQIASLERAYIFKNELTSLDASNLENLQYLNLYNNQVSSILVKNLPSLELFYGQGNNLQSDEVDTSISDLASGSPELVALVISGNEAPTSSSSAAIQTLTDRGCTVTTS